MARSRFTSRVSGARRRRSLRSIASSRPAPLMESSLLCQIKTSRSDSSNRRGRDGFQRVPMLGDLPVLDSVHVVKRGGAIAEGPLAHYKHEIAFPEHPVSPVVLHRRAPCSQGLQTGDKTSEFIGDDLSVFEPENIEGNS